MTPRFRSLPNALAVYTAFFASGAACLIAEVTWNRMLIVIVGNSMSAAAMIIAVFMGGLGLGSFVGGRIFGRRRPSLVPYLLLELTIGCLVLLSPWVFSALSGLFTTLAEVVENRAGLTLVRIGVSLTALFLPAFLMGATFPAIIAGAALESPGPRSARIGYLYSINTVGAALGCFAAGYHLLLEFGVQATLRIAFGLYLLAAASALIANVLMKRTPPGAVPGPAAGAGGPEKPGVSPRFLGAATAGIGFVALAYEVLLTRLGILYLGNSVSVFPLVLTGFLLGTGISAVLGTWLYGVLDRRPGGGRRLFAAAALGAGVLVLATPYMLLSDRVVSSDQFARFADAGVRNPLPILGLIIAPTVLIGMLLPVAIRMLRAREAGTATRGAANLYALNTAGGLLGAGLANQILVPLIGIQGTVLLLTVICAAIGVFGLIGSPARPRLRVAAAAGAVVPVILLAVFLPDMMHLYAGKIADATEAETVAVRFLHEGRAATVAVLDQDDPRMGGAYRDMYLNGVEEASTRYWHTQLFKLLGILPVLMHESPDPKDALVIAFGAGITAGSVLASPDVASVDVVDLNPDIEDIGDYFTEVNGDVCHRPRFRFHNDDGRNYLVTCNKQYDLIIGDSTHPRAYDSWILYTEEFYRSVQRRLRPGGVFAQWVPVLGSMQGDLFRIHLNTFCRVFPHATFWYVYGSDQAFLMATPEPFILHPARLQEKLDRLPGWFRAGEYQIDTAARVAGFFWMDGAAMAAMIGDETRINTDDFHFFDKQSAVRPGPPERRLPAFQASILPYVAGADPALAEAVREQQETALHLARYGFYGDRSELFKAFCAMPENGNARWFTAMEFGGILPDPGTFCGNAGTRGLWMQVAAQPDNVVALNALADLLSETGDLDAALSLAQRAVALTPGNGMVLDTYGWILYQQGDYPAALKALRRSAAQFPNHPVALFHLGAALLAVGDAAPAREYLTRALAIPGGFKDAGRARDLLARTDARAPDPD